ncbi:MAG: transcriptional regulator protein [Proteobacteria bacterium]|nr:transcriptional regulator protein [Pseudomonadota bacterium]
MDRLTSMRIFVKAVELGSFSAAASALGLSSQLVGKHIRTLEQSLGVRLLNRTTRQQSLTDIGRNYYERVRQILADVTAAEDFASEMRLSPRGRLKVSAPVTFGIHALAPKLPDYFAAYPDVSVDLHLSNRYVDLIDEGFDVAFRVGQLVDSSLIGRPLAPYRLIVCATPDYLAAHGAIDHPADLKGRTCLGFSFGTLATEWQFEGPEGRVTVPISGRMVSDSGEALLAVALSGQGVLMQSAEMLEPLIAAGKLVRLLPDHRIPARPFHVLFAPDRRPTPKLRTFIDFSVAAFGK